MGRADQLILDHLRTRRRADPASIRDLQDRFGGSQREIKAAVERIRQEHLIGASRSRPAGYWWPVTDADREAALRPFAGQARKMLAMLWRHAGGKRVQKVVEQAALDFGEAA